MTKGERIKLLREKANMTQEELAKLLICIEDEDDHNGHLKRLYDEISKIYETSPGSVESTMDSIALFMQTQNTDPTQPLRRKAGQK